MKTFGQLFCTVLLVMPCLVNYAQIFGNTVIPADILKATLVIETSLQWNQGCVRPLLFDDCQEIRGWLKSGYICDFNRFNISKKQRRKAKDLRFHAGGSGVLVCKSNLDQGSRWEGHDSYGAFVRLPKEAA